MSPDTKDLLLVLTPFLFGYGNLLFGFGMIWLATQMGFLYGILFVAYPIILLCSFLLGYIAWKVTKKIVDKY